ncbi:MAG: hypothetical protein ABI791_02195 [Acidobacteriota bacterium]
MLRIVLGVVAGFFAWIIVWVGVEKILSTVLPEWYGAPQQAFQAAIENGGEFTAETRLLVSHIFIVSIVSALSGFLATLVARENARAPLALGFVLLVMGLAKAYMSWPYVPLWYHILFTALLLPMAVAGGRLYSAN